MCQKLSHTISMNNRTVSRHIYFMAPVMKQAVRMRTLSSRTVTIQQPVVRFRSVFTYPCSYTQPHTVLVLTCSWTELTIFSLCYAVVTC